MAEIIPLRAWRYNEELAKNIETLTSPLFDVVNEEQRNKLYQNPYSSIHLSVPKGNEPAAYSGDILRKWKENGIILQDHVPSFYVYYQHFKLKDSDHNYIRKGFIGNIRIKDWHEGDIRRHESTMPFSVEDRISILDNTQLNVSPTHGLYTDPDHQIEKFLDESISNPIYDVEDYQGVRDVFSVIQDVRIIRKIMEIMSHRKIILADGHHRLEGSIEYMLRRKEQNPTHTGTEPYNYHLMYFTNTESDDLRILPTHRLVRHSIDESTFLNDLSHYFKIEDCDSIESLLSDNESYGIILKDRIIKIILKVDWRNIEWEIPDLLKALDLTILHYFVLEKVIGMTRKEQQSGENLSFEKDTNVCKEKVDSGEFDMALITNEIPIDTVKKVCTSGHTMPQKSTYFYPKVISGFLFSSIKEDEFQSYFDPGI